MDTSVFDLGPVLHTLSLLTRPDVLGLVLLGNVVGLIFGVLPGISGGQAFVVALPLTFGWDPEVAVWFLMGMLGATSFGGAMCAILINVPGDSTNAATCFDGYPLAQRGQARRALGVAATSNVLGSTFGMVVLVALFPVMRPIVLAFGPPEFFWLTVMGLTMIALAARGSFLKGLAGGGIGLLISLIGFSSVIGVSRFTGGRDYLWDGIQLIAMFIGLFAIAQAIDFCASGSSIATHDLTFSGRGRLLDGVRDVLRTPVTLLRGSAFGAFFGMVPGIGGTAAAFLSYTIAQQFSKKPYLFHHGNPEGIVASESAANAKELGGLMPMLAFGIPGSIEAALVLGALMFHGIQPGPFLLRDKPGVVWALILSLWASNVLGTLLGIVVANWLAKLTAVRAVYLAPIILVISLVGTYLWRGNLWDVFVAILAGVVGFGLIKAGFSVVPFIIGFLLGEIAERAFFQSMQISNGSLLIFFERPVALVIFVATTAVVVAAFWRTRQLRRGARRLAEAP